MKVSQIIGLILIAGLLAAMVSLMGDFSSYETFASSRENPQKELHVIGYLDTTKEMNYDPLVDPNKFEFYAQDEQGEVSKVILKDSKPQDFEKSEQLVMIGHMQDSTFICNEILMKCPSKYQDENGPQVDENGYISNTQS